MVDVDAVAGVSAAGRAPDLGLDLVGRDQVRVSDQRLLRDAHHRPERHLAQRVSGQHEAASGGGQKQPLVGAKF